jgi:hypothetical protein
MTGICRATALARRGAKPIRRLRRARIARADRATGERVIAACERREGMIDALLTLAHNDHGLTRSDEPIDLAASGAERIAPEQESCISEATGGIVVSRRARQPRMRNE